MWVNGEKLSYNCWYRNNSGVRCVSLEAMLKKDKKLLARYCEELHMFVCQGPVSPQPVAVDSVESDHVMLSWNVSAFMQMTPHSYNVTTCTNTCDTLFYPCTDGCTFMNINISNLISATEYFIQISTIVVRPANTGGNVTRQSDPTALYVRTADYARQYKPIIVILRLLKLVYLAPPLWILYCILKKNEFKESDHDVSPVECSTEETMVNLILVKTRGFGHGSEIIGGKEVEPHSLPFMALLENNNGPVCGGILISPKWVLTAAHCAPIQKVLLGVHSINDKEKDSRQVRKAKSFPHPCYDATDKVNDLMLLKLDKPVKETKTVKCHPLGNTIKEPAGGTNCLVAGWGKTKNNSKQMSNVLMSVNVTVVDRAKCNSPEYYNLNPVITRSMICAGSNGKNTADTCQGDSGGPLLCNGALVGVTSFGRRCGVIKNPGVYSFLAEKQLIWIKKTMKKSEI
ncbi:granzyme A-like [Symphorus nematophorus]